MSSAEIGLRVQKSSANPLGYLHIDKIPSDEVCVVYLGGDGATDDKAANGYAKIIEHTKMSQEEVRYYKNLINCSDLYLVEKFKRIAVKNNKNIPIPVNCALYQIVKTNTGRITLSNIMAKIMNIQNMVKILENSILYQNLDLQSIINNINEEYQQLPDENNQLLIKKSIYKIKK